MRTPFSHRRIIPSWRSDPLGSAWLGNPFLERWIGSRARGPREGGLKQAWRKASTIAILASSRPSLESGGVAVGPGRFERLKAFGAEKIIDT
jgi:hypothetical protein